MHGFRLLSVLDLGCDRAILRQSRRFARSSEEGIEKEPLASHNLQQLPRNRYRHLDTALLCVYSVPN